MPKRDGGFFLLLLLRYAKGTYRNSSHLHLFCRGEHGFHPSLLFLRFLMQCWLHTVILGWWPVLYNVSWLMTAVFPPPLHPEHFSVFHWQIVLLKWKSVTVTIMNLSIHWKTGDGQSFSLSSKRWGKTGPGKSAAVILAVETGETSRGDV